MMQAIRTRAGSIIVKALFVLLIVSFGFWGIYTRSPFSQSQSADTVVATVGDRDITVAEMQKAVQPALERLRKQFGASVDAQQMKQLGILDTILGQLIDRSLLDQQASHLGLEVSDAVIRSTIYDNPAFRGPDGRFDRQRFEQVLMMNQLTEDQLVAQLRSDIPRGDLLQALVAGVTVSHPVVAALYRYRSEKRLADIVAFPAAAVTSIGQPSEAALKKFYEDHKDLFQAPEFRGFTLASLAPADLKEPGTIPDDKLRKEYDQRQDEFVTPEQREIQQILAPSEAKAKEAAAALKAGKDWKTVATTIAGQDPDTIDLGLLSRKQIPHELGDIAFALPLNQPSQPIKSPLGWHILRVVKITPGTTESFAQVKPKLIADLKLQDAVGRLDKIGNAADDALAGGANLADIAKKYGLKLTSAPAIDESGAAPDGKRVPLPFAPAEILKTVFATNQGETSRVTDTRDGAIFAVRVDKITAPQTRPLAAVRDKAIVLWQAEQKAVAAQKEAEALAAAVKPGLPLAKAASDKRLTLLATTPLSRVPQPGQSVPPALVAKLFAAKPGDVVTTSDATAAYTAQLKTIETPPTVPEAAAQGLSDQLAGDVKLDLAEEFTASLRRRFPVEVKRDALDRMF
ncbi:MAG TPA: SurA N-terminal domain-containing protein [Stellaceae bacterium]|nr:SurA N-terminal domain-containing protein [Stellaceae bacterium]